MIPRTGDNGKIRMTDSPARGSETLKSDSGDKTALMEISIIHPSDYKERAGWLQCVPGLPLTIACDFESMNFPFFENFGIVKTGNVVGKNSPA